MDEATDIHASDPGHRPPHSEEPPSGSHLTPELAELLASIRRRLGPYAADLLNRSGQPMLITELGGRILQANRAFLELLGYSEIELQGRPVLDITPPTWHPTTDTAFSTLLAEGRPLHYEKVYLARDGREVPVDLVADLFRDENGHPLGSFAFITDLTEQKRAGRAARESETRFRQLFDEAPFGYHEIDAEGRILLMNHTEGEMLGVDPASMIGRPVFDLVAEPEREESRRSVSEKVAGTRPLRSFERTFVRADGRVFPVSIRERYRFDERGQVAGLRSTIQDITEQRQMQEALVASERRARALFEGIDDAVIVHDLEGRILDANPAASKLFGFTREELLNLHTRDIDSAEFGAGFKDRLARQLELGHLAFEGQHRTRDGRIVPVEIRSSVILFEGQRAILAVVRDIAERQALEATRRQFAEAQMRYAEQMASKNRALVESEARYRQLTEATLDAVVVADHRGMVTLFNPAAERTFDYQSHEVIGHPASLLFDEDGPFTSLDDLLLDLTRLAPRFVGRTVELRGRRRSGEPFPLELSLSAVGHQERLQFIGSIRDQTERQRMRAMLVQSEKLASIGLLSAGVAHEINNPLAYVANNLAVLERDLRGLVALVDRYEAAEPALAQVQPEATADLDRIRDDLDWAYVRDNLPRLVTRTREGVQRVAGIVQNLRGLARTAPAKMEPVLLADLIAGAVEMIQGQLKRSSTRLELDIPPGLPKIPCVPNQISQVLLNLLINAAQAIESNPSQTAGRILVEVRETPEGQSVDVLDNGCGIEPDHLPRLFDPFFTTKPVGEGTGLGLSISHGIVTGHGGRIEVVESRPGLGTRFRIVLPAHE